MYQSYNTTETNAVVIAIFDRVIEDSVFFEQSERQLMLQTTKEQGLLSAVPQRLLVDGRLRDYARCVVAKGINSSRSRECVVGARRA